MKISLPKILSKVLDVTGMVVPQVAQARTLVNNFLPKPDRLGPEATGQDVVDAYSQLPVDSRNSVDQRAALEIAEIEASVDKLQAMVSVESAGSNTRPKIALMMAWVIILITLALMAILFTAVINGDSELMDAVTGLWPLALAALATPAAVVRAYFGMRTQDKKARYQAATGHPVAQGLGAALIKSFSNA